MEQQTLTAKVRGVRLDVDIDVDEDEDLIHIGVWRINEDAEGKKHMTAVASIGAEEQGIGLWYAEEEVATVRTGG
jgi:hypothetical protein